MATDRKESIALNITRTDYSKRETTAHLSFETSKHSNGIVSRADVSWHGNGFKTHAFGLASDGSGDWSRRLLEDRTKRGTQANIDRQHAAVFTPEKRAELEAEARAWYDAQDAAKAAKAAKLETVHA